MWERKKCVRMIPNFLAKVSDNIYWELKAWKKRPESWERRGSKEFQTHCEKKLNIQFWSIEYGRFRWQNSGWHLCLASVRYCLMEENWSRNTREGEVLGVNDKLTNYGNVELKKG